MAKPGKTFVAVPLYQNPDSVFVNCLLQMQHEERSGNFIIQTLIGDSCVARARNNLTNAFLQSDCDRLLFIDCDIVFNTAQVRRIASHTEPIVGGFYFAKQESPKPILNLLDSGPGVVTKEGLQEVKYIGTGFLCIHRTVFDVMAAKMHDELWFTVDETKTPTIGYSFWEDNVYRYPDGNRRFLTEDWMFCQRARDLGFKVWADTQILVGHRGMAEYPLTEDRKKILSVDQSAGTPAAPVSSVPLPGADTAGAAALPVGFILPPEAADDAKQIMSGCYDVPGLKEAPKTILDAGAHVGLFTHWAKSKWPDAEVRCAEPHSGTCQLLIKNTRSLRKIAIFHQAISNHNNEIELFRGRNSLCHSVDGKLADGPVFKAPCVNANSIGRFDFVKVDTEGSELPILSSLDLTETKAVVCEAHSEQDRRSIAMLLDGLGFEPISCEPSVNGCFLMKFARPDAIKGLEVVK